MDDGGMCAVVVRSNGPLTPDVPDAEAAPAKAWAVTRRERMATMFNLIPLVDM